MATMYMRGHLVVWDEHKQVWIYADTNEEADYERPCPRCGKNATLEGYDACLGRIDGVAAACCGHGVHNKYVMTGNTKKQRRK